MDEEELQQLNAVWRKEKALALEKSSALLQSLAARLRQTDAQTAVLQANQRDLNKLHNSDPMYDRLLLSEQRLCAIASDLEQVAQLRCPVGEQLYSHQIGSTAQNVPAPNSQNPEVRLVRVPIGLILVIFESRPNVTLDLFSLALRSGNLLLLKGGKEAYESNCALLQLIREQLQQAGLSSQWAELLGTSREELGLLLQQHRYIDLCIPRGSASLIRFVRENSQIPIIETGAGVVHLFCDEGADARMAANLIYNSKLRRLSVCNALDCLLLHRNQLPQLPLLVESLAQAQVVLHCDAESYAALQNFYSPKLLQQIPTGEEQSVYGREFLSAQLCVKVLGNVQQAIEHIERYGSRHTEVIVTENAENAELFCQEVDAAAVFVNMASGFSDGGQFGLGAEVGISTQKLHARGPMGLEALTCAKWFGRGFGQCRNS